MNPIPIADFKSLFETLPGLYLILNPDFTIVAVSDAYLKATMTDRETITGRDLFEVFPDNPDDKEATGVSNLRTSLNAVLQLGQPNKMAVQQYDIRNSDGLFIEKYWSQLNTPVLNDAHELVYIIHNVVEATDQHKASEKFKKSEKDYQLLVSSVKDYAIFMVDPKGLVASWNSGAESIKGYTAAEIIGRPIDVFYTAEDIKQGVPQSNLQMALQHGHFEAEGWRQRKDGTLFWANIVFTALKDEAGVLYVYSKITRDITERKNAQEQLESLTRQIDQSNDAIFTTDINRKIRNWNMGAQNLYGFTKEEVVGKDPSEILRTAITKEDMSIGLNAIAEHNYWTEEVRRKTKTGKDISVRSSVTAIRDSKGVITGYVAVSFDITEQMSLREQVNHLANIVEQSSEAIISRGMDQRFISWNSGAERLFGYSKEEAIGKTPLELLFTMLTEQEITDISQQVIEKGSWNSEREFFHKNGSSFFGSVAANPVRNEQGEMTSMVFIMKDISLSKQLEEQLKKYNLELEKEVMARTEEIVKSENRFRALVENNYDIISLIDESFNIIYRSPSVKRVRGCDTGAMKKLEGIENVHPDDREYAANLIREAMENSGKPLTAMFRRQHKNGHYIWLEGKVTNLLHDVQVKAIVTNFRDVTERIEAEEKIKTSENLFRALIENSNDIITLMDDSLKLLYRSPSAARLTGWANEDMIGVEATKNIHPEDQPLAASIVTEVIANPAKTITGKFRMRHKNGHYLWVEGTLTNLLHDKDVKAIVFNFHDVSERIKAEQQKEFDAHNLNALINNTHDLMWSVDRNFKLITANEAFDNIVRVISGKTIPKGSNILIKELGDVQLERYKKYYERAFSGETFSEIEHNGTAEDFWSEISFYPIYEGKSVIGTACFSRNVTEKKKAEEHIRKSNERFELVVTATNDVIWDWDINSNTFWRNKNYYTHFGYNEKTVSPDTSAWHDGIHPDDKKRVLSGVNRIIKNKGHFWTEEYRYLKSDNTIAFVMDSGYILYTEKGKAYRMVGAMLDISDRKKAEQELKSSFDEKQALAERMSIILNTLPANIALLDGNGYIIDVNDSWRNFADDNGFTGSSYCIGDNYLDISKNASGEEKEDGKKVTRGIKGVLKNKVKEFVFEYTCDSPKIKRWFRMVGTPLQEKEYAGAVVMHIDISELRRLEQKRLKSKMDEQKKITKAILVGQEKERNHIGQELHDNINQILAGTKIYLGIAGNKNKEVKELIKYPIELIDTSIEEIRLLCHKMVTPLKNIKLEELIQELLNKLDQSTKIKVEFIYSVTDGILSDDLQLNIYRIIQELVNNILKYANAKNVKIVVKTNKKDIHITVMDDGKGFDLEKNRKGIGISNMINRVGSFNGEIKIESSAGNGCKTSINIPY